MNDITTFAFSRSGFSWTVAGKYDVTLAYRPPLHTHTKNTHSFGHMHTLRHKQSVTKAHLIMQSVGTANQVQLAYRYS